jgi:tRNA-Thr(GGU) m(6)t(6)A37 methyltransferase TsaA
MIEFKKIGIIHSPFEKREGMPIQPCFAEGAKGRVILDPEYMMGLKSLEGFSHIILIYYFHEAREYRLTQKPFLDSEEHGIFAVRHPSRPNHIGISTVRLLSINENILDVENIDVLNCTPLLDIKPYVPAFDSIPDAKSGWLENKITKK